LIPALTGTAKGRALALGGTRRVVFDRIHHRRTDSGACRNASI